MPGQNYTHLFIAAESAIIRRGLVSLVQAVSQVQLLGEAQTLSELASVCPRLAPDVILLSSEVPIENQLSVIHQLRQTLHSVRVILILTTNDQTLLDMITGDPLVTCLNINITEQQFTERLNQIRGPQQRSSAASMPSRSSSAMAQELAMAGQIQANILPEKVPELHGWDISARLLPARETSGDFYDFIPVTDKNWGIVIADVADKGMGAALFMTLTSTLFRGLAARHPGLPGLTLETVNERILTDTRGSMFVTAFIGVLEPHTGRMRYANAGHPPPLLVKSQKGKPIDRLARTGMALGVQEEQHWSQKLVILSPGDVLVLYTDGVIEAQNPQGRLFDFPRLQDVVHKVVGRSAKTILNAILSEVHQFTEGATAQDDIAIVVIRRDET